MARIEAGIVDDDIPLAPSQRIQLAIPVSNQSLDPREHAGVRAAPVEQRQCVTSLKRVANLMRSDEAGAAQDQDAERGLRQSSMQTPE